MIHDFDEPHPTIRAIDQFYRIGMDDVPDVVLYQRRIFWVSFTNDNPPRIYLIEHKGQERFTRELPDVYVRWDKYGRGHSRIAVFDSFQSVIDVLGKGGGVIEH